VGESDCAGLGLEGGEGCRGFYVGLDGCNVVAEVVEEEGEIGMVPGIVVVDGVCFVGVLGGVVFVSLLVIKVVLETGIFTGSL
jgi:hypothetical protein